MTGFLKPEEFCGTVRQSPGYNAEKIWVHWFLTKPRMIAAGGLVGAVSRQDVHGDALVKAWVRSSRTIFFSYKTC